MLTVKPKPKRQESNPKVTRFC